MATFKRRKNRITAVVRLKQGSRSKTFDTLTEAQNWALETEAYLKRTRHLVRGRTLGEAFERYANEISPTRRGERWEAIRLAKLCRDSLADITLETLTAGDLEGWKDRALAQGLKSSSWNREFNLVAAVIEQCRRWQWVESNVTREVVRPKDPLPRNRRINDHEIELVLNALKYREGATPTQIKDYLAVAFLLALEMGLRQGEIWSLRSEHLHLDAAYLKLIQTKNGHPRDVPLSHRAMALLRTLVPGRGGRLFCVAQPSAQTIWRQAIASTGIEDLHFHDTRHEACTRLARKLDMLDLARMIGHRDPRSLMIYYNPSATEIAERLNNCL